MTPPETVREVGGLPPEAPDAPKSAHLQADATLLLLTAMWGATFVVVKTALERADPFTFLALRFAIGATAVTAMARGRVLDRAALRAGLLLGLFLFLGFALQTTGLRHTTPSRSAFITGLNVVVVPFASIALFRKWPSPWAFAGIALSILGLYCLTEGGDRSAATLRGDFLTMGCAVAYALHVSLTALFARKVPIAALVAVQLWVVSLLSAACVPLVERWLDWSWGLTGALAFTGIVASALALTVQSWGQARTTAVRAALIFSLEPLFTAACSALLGSERLGGRELAGGALIVLGVLVAELGSVLWAKVSRSVS